MERVDPLNCKQNYRRMFLYDDSCDGVVASGVCRILLSRLGVVRYAVVAPTYGFIVK
jgi:hypothetical protein